MPVSTSTGRIPWAIGEISQRWPSCGWDTSRRPNYSLNGEKVGHSEPLATFIDQDLLQYDTIWAAAGTPRAVFELTPDDLVKMTGGQVIDVS